MLQRTAIFILSCSKANPSKSNLFLIPFFHLQQQQQDNKTIGGLSCLNKAYRRS